MKVISPFRTLGSKYINNYLLEKDHKQKFSFVKKLYYNFLRPILPLHLRKKIQERVTKNIYFKDNFIFNDFLEIVKSLPDYKNTINFLYPDNQRTAIVLTHDVEGKDGFGYIPEVIELERRYGFKSSWNIVPYKYKIDLGIIDYIRECGGEIGIHGYNHDGKLYMSKKIFNKRVPFINNALERFGAVGFRSPMVHRNLEWLQSLDIEYDASCFDYDPFQPFPGGTGSIWPFIAGKFIELPYTLPQDHTLFYILKVKKIDIWKNKIDWIVKNNGVVLVLTHPDYLMEKNHMWHYEELLKYLQTVQNSWHCLPKELARHFRKIIKPNT